MRRSLNSRMENLIKILSEYDVGKADKISRISTGLINETYLVEAGDNKFILQRLNPIFKKDAIFDLDVVLKHLNERGDMVAQKLFRTIDGKLFFEHIGEVWRLLSFIPGKVFIKTPSPEIVCEAGKILGKFHLSVGDLEYKFRHVRPMHHATETFFAKLKKISIDAADLGLRCQTDSIFGIQKLCLPANLRKNITHGDPKISNIIFEEPAPHRFKAKALIDLDDCGREHNVLIELGDAFRSWCSSEEDDENNRFDLEKFKAALDGYLEGSKNFLKKEEMGFLLQAIKLITLELATRFLIDYFEDSYFGWDSNKYDSRKEHNLARIEGQLALFCDLEQKSEKIHTLVNISLTNYKSGC